MRTLQRGLHQTLQSLVISLALFFISCSTLKQDLERNKKEIIEKEISRLLPFFVDKKVYLDFNLNNYIKEFLEENKLNKNTYLINWLSKEEIGLIFNKEDDGYLIEQTQQNEFNIHKLYLSKNIILNDTQKEKENIKGDGLKSANYRTRERLFLSIPIITKNKNYAIIAYSYGSIDSSSGGIRIYKKTGQQWQFYQEIKS